MSCLLLVVVIAGWPGGGAGQQGPSQVVPQAVLDGAEAATRILSGEVMKGNFGYSMEKMYPRWKKRAAKRLGGEDKLAQRLLELPQQMRKNGITMLKFEVLKPKAGHEVVLRRGEDGAGKPIHVYLEWLVFVPTREPPVER